MNDAERNGLTGGVQPDRQSACVMSCESSVLAIVRGTDELHLPDGNDVNEDEYAIRGGRYRGVARISLFLSDHSQIGKDEQ